MLLDTIFAPFVKERPICVMARAVLYTHREISHHFCGVNFRSQPDFSPADTESEMMQR
jgi:hypothetical protein